MEIFKYSFIQNALISAFLVNIVCGIVGTFIVTKKITFIAGGLSHAAFGGIGLGFFLGLNPIFIAFPFSVCISLLVGFISKKTKINEDTAIGIIWAFGMAIGVIFINLTKDYTPDLFSFLFGNILTITKSDILFILGLTLFVLLLSSIFFKEFVLISLDEEYAKVLGVAADFFYYLLLLLIATCIIVLIKVVGIVLLIALLTIPAVIAKIFVYKIKIIIILSIFIGIFITLTGLIISYFINMPSGALIVVFASLLFFICYLIKKLVGKIIYKINKFKLNLKFNIKNST